MISSEKIMLTGATGFVGQALLGRFLLSQGTEVVALVRRHSQKIPSGVTQVIVNDDITWADTAFPEGVATVIHLAGRAHVLKEVSSSPIDLYRADNVGYTLSLARKALASGVKRFVFISSIGVNGPSTDSVPFNETSTPSPQTDYAVSKWEAEQALKELLNGSGMELVIIRPPLVFASHAPGNFHRLMKLVSMGLPLPLASIDNCRSMVSLESLVDFISLCAKHPAAANETFLISDGVDFSTAKIIELLAHGMGKRVLIFPFPSGLLRLGARAVGMEKAFEQLCGSLVIDSTKAHAVLGWRAPMDANQALISAGQNFRSANFQQK